MTRLNEILSNQRFIDLEFLTNHKKELLDSEVKSVEISDTPDIDLFIPENIILLTTGMVFKDRQEDLKDYLFRLKQAKVLALGIKTGRFLRRLDDEIIAYANSIDLPIFNIPDQYSLGFLLHQLTNLMWDGERENLLLSIDAQRDFAGFLSTETNLDQILNSLAKYLNSPVLLLNHFYYLRSSSHDLAPYNVSPNELIAAIKVEQEKTRKRFGQFLLNLGNNKKFNISISKVTTKNFFPDYLVILNSKISSQIFEKLLLSQATLVMNYNLLKDQQAYIYNQKRSQDLFYEMLKYAELEFDRKQEWIENYISGFLRITNHYQVIIAKINLKSEAKRSSRYHKELDELIDEWLYINLSQHMPDTIHFPHKNKKAFILFSQFNIKDLNKHLIQLNEDIQKDLPISLTFFLGNPVDEISQINKSYSQADLIYLNKAKPKNTIYSHQKIGYEQLFNPIDPETIEYFCRFILQDYAYPVDQYNTDLRDTLEVYLDNQCEISKTAKSLFIHRNTVIYRIQRCEEDLGIEISDPENSLNLRIALALSKNKKD